MKRIALASLATAICFPVVAADIGVSVSVNQPGIYGRIDIGNLPPPQLVYPEPVLIRPLPPGAVAEPPLYLHVPPGHERKWSKHCARYNACGRPVYFVHEDWYRNVYAPRHRDERGDRRRDEGRDHGRREDRNEHERDRGEGHGRGRHED